MTDLLEQGAAWLDDQRVKHMSRAVVYCRGDDSAEVQATIGRTVFEIDNGTGVLEKTESRDFLVSTAELTLAGEETLPLRGDRIRETDAAQVFVYEVMAPGREPHWRYCDPYRKTLRIHTKHVDTEAA